jgi:N utilization substance protein B
MAARRKARRRALDILFEADMRGADALATLADVQQRRRAKGEPPLNPYTEALVTGVTANRTEIDEQLATYAIGWTLDRMPVVDRNVLRIGTYELLMDRTVPPGVAIAEAVLLAKELSTDESPRFINGLLSRLLELAGPDPAFPAADSIGDGA